MRRWLFLVFLLSLPGLVLLAQVPDDLQCSFLLHRGRAALEAGDYPKALRNLEEACRRPFNVHTTASLYLTGLAWEKQGDRQLARDYYLLLISEYPKSRYRDDARYHLALLNVHSYRDDLYLQGMDELILLSSGSEDTELAAMADIALREQLFDRKSVGWIWEYYQLWATPGPQAIVEALCYKLIQENDDEPGARDIYLRYKLSGGQSSAFLDALFSPEERQAPADMEPMRIVLVLSLPARGVISDSAILASGEVLNLLQWYEGIKLGIRAFGEQQGRRIHLSTVNPGDDPYEWERLLRGLDADPPDILIGGVREEEIRYLAAWANSRSLPHFVPLSAPSGNPRFQPSTFYVRPSVSVHGRRIAEYARDSLGLERVAIWSDGGQISEELTETFTYRFEMMGGEVIYQSIPPTFQKDSTQRRLRMQLRRLRTLRPDGIYLPITGNETISGLVLSFLSLSEWEGAFDGVRVLGSPHWWKRYSTIDPELKQNWKLTFSSSFFSGEEWEEYLQLQRDFFREYRELPGEQAIRGYDLGKYLATIAQDYPGRYMALQDWIRIHPEVPGLHLNYYFAGGQVNQFVNIAGFEEGGILLLNRNPPEPEIISIPDAPDNERLVEPDRSKP